MKTRANTCNIAQLLFSASLKKLNVYIHTS